MTDDRLVDLIASFASEAQKFAKQVDRVSDDKILLAQEQLIADIEELRTLKGKMSKLKKRADHLAEIIKNQMGDHEILQDEEGETLCTFKYSSSYEKFNEQLFKADHPNTWAKYTELSNPNRPLVLK